MKFVIFIVIISFIIEAAHILLKKKVTRCKKCGAELVVLPRGSGHPGGCSCGSRGTPPGFYLMDEPRVLRDISNILIHSQIGEGEIISILKEAAKLRDRGISPEKVLMFEYDRRFNKKENASD